MTSPSLFSFATSELSQDAFICWFLSWADEKYKTTDEELHVCAIKFLEKLFSKHSISLPSVIHHISIRKQDKNIDVLCEINNEYVIIIEDKTFTEEHSGQLKRYVDEVLSREYAENKIVPIYFKTEDQSNYRKIEKAGYKPFLRRDMLDILEQYNGTNAIILDYRNHLHKKEKRVTDFALTPVDKWGWYNWVGFFKYLQTHLKDGDWAYVPNPNGGFNGFWWCFNCDSEADQYIQLEDTKLCFKISVDDSADKKQLRSKWCKKIIEQSKTDHPNLNLTKPSRFGTGEYMTVCIASDSYIQKNPDNTINIKDTLNILQKAEEVLKNSVACV